MKKILVSVPFVILIILDVLFSIEYSEMMYGALGILQFSYIDPATELVGHLCFPIGPVLLVTYFYAKVVTRNQINAKALGSWTLLILGTFLTLIYQPDQVLESVFPEQYYFGRRMLALAFAGLGVIGITYPRIIKLFQPHSPTKSE